MIRVVTLLAFAGLLAGGADAQEPKADCKLFKRASNGQWMSTVDSKIGNPKSFIKLDAGKPIDPKLTVVGVNVSDTIDQLCGGK